MGRAAVADVNARPGIAVCTGTGGYAVYHRYDIDRGAWATEEEGMEQPPLALSAERLLADLEPNLTADSRAWDWVAALLGHGRDAAAEAAGDTDLDALEHSAETAADRGAVLSAIDVVRRAGLIAAAEERPVVSTTDIAAAILQSTEGTEDRGMEQPPLALSAERLLADLEHNLTADSRAWDWVAALLGHGRDAAAEAAGDTDLDTLKQSAETAADRGAELSATDVVRQAGIIAAHDDRPVISTTDIAAAILQSTKGAIDRPPTSRSEKPAYDDGHEAAAERTATFLTVETTAPESPAHVRVEPPVPELRESAGPADQTERQVPEVPDESVAAASAMPSGVGRTFRLFVSSTFSDLQEERNALHREVFPELQKECARHGARFQAIDLRWGVSTEAGLDQKTMPLCLGEIERCQQTDRPNFLVLLGDRYGWRPLPATIPADEFDQIRDVVKGYARDLLEAWYVRDDNAVPPEYYLRPREKNGPYGVSEEGQATWAELERELGAILRSAVEQPDVRAEARVKYLASATEQEIEVGALGVRDADEHVFCFFRTIDGLPHDETAGSFEDIIDGHVDQDAVSRLGDLKQRLRRHVPDNVATYHADWNPDQHGPSTDHLEQLCQEVLQRLKGAIQQRFAKDAAKTPLHAEIEAHEQFGRDRAEVFVGRVNALEAVAAYTSSRPGRLLVIHGESGSGKSALMARAAHDVAGGDGELVVRFVGATGASSEGRSLLANLCRQIGQLYGDDGEVPADYRELVQEFPKRLKNASAAKPLIVFLDALDQLDKADPARSLTWLPAQLPDHVGVVVSTLPGDTLDALQSKRPEAEFVEVEPMPEDEADELLSTWFHEAGRTLQNDQRSELLNAFKQDGLPLYLKLAFEEARLWRSQDKQRELKPDVRRLIGDNLFDRLGDPEHHGEVLVSRALGYLAASRYGLAEDELLSVLSTDDKVMGWIKAEAADTGQKLPEVVEGEQRVPVVLWSRLRADLEPYLSERATEGAIALTFYHPQFGEVARDTYLGDGAGRERNAALARYFRSRVDPEGNGTWTGQDVRGLSELPYHLTEAEKWEAVEEVLTDFRFLERKVAEVGIVEQSDADGKPTKLYTGVYQLRDDYDHALRAMGGESDEQRHRIIVTAVDLGNGLEIRCPHCNRMIPWDEEYRGDEMTCPLDGCGGPLKVNPFVVGERA